MFDEEEGDGGGSWARDSGVLLKSGERELMPSYSLYA